MDETNAVPAVSAAPGFEVLERGEEIAAALLELKHEDCGFEQAYDDASARIRLRGWDVYCARVVEAALARGRDPRDVSRVILEVALEHCPPVSDLERALFALAHCTVAMGESPWTCQTDLCETGIGECVPKEVVHVATSLSYLREPTATADEAETGAITHRRMHGLADVRDLAMAVAEYEDVDHAAAFVRDLEERLGQDGAGPVRS